MIPWILRFHPNWVNKISRSAVSSPSYDTLRATGFSPHEIQNFAARRDAAAAFEEAIRLRPDFAAAHFHLGAVCLQQQQLGEAASELGKAAELAPQDALPHFYLAKTLAAQSKNSEALQELRKAARLKPYGRKGRPRLEWRAITGRDRR